MSEINQEEVHQCACKAAESQEPKEKVIYPFVVSVRFHNATRSYTFGTYIEDLQKGDRVVVQTSQGVELGECTSAAQDRLTSVNPDMDLAPVLRRAGEEDVKQFNENFELAKEAFQICDEEINALQLNMHLISADYMLDRTKILFVYQAENRVDFRELLKQLGARLHCRIELRQVGERDKAKMVGGIGMCGMELCCARFKTHMDVISINMAKTQLLALNTEKLSGMCGKLMCCLKYENDNYKELTQGLPKLGAHVEFDNEIYRVSSINVMTNEARIENADSYQVITCDELREKAIVRKGIAIARHSTHKGPKQNVSKDAARQIPGVKQQQNASVQGNTAGSFGISSASKQYQSNHQKPIHESVEKRNTKDTHSGLVPQAKTSNKEVRHISSNNQQKRNNVRRPQHTENKNANVTVRSFKSSKPKGE